MAWAGQGSGIEGNGTAAGGKSWKVRIPRHLGAVIRGSAGRWLAAFVFLGLFQAQAFALDEGVGRVLAVVKTTGTTAEVELQVENYALYHNSPVEVFTPAGKVAATLVIPGGVDMLRKGDKTRVALQLKSAFSLAGGLVTEPGKFAGYAALVKALGPGAAGPAAPATSAPAAPAPAAPAASAGAPSVTACPYSAAELKGALGLDLSDGKADMEIPFPGGKALGCRYQGKGANTPSLWLKHTVMNNPAAPENANYFKALAGKLQKVPGDPDGAAWQAHQGDNTQAALVYLRKGVIVEARVTVTPREPGFEATKAKLLRLRRVP